VVAFRKEHVVVAFGGVASSRGCGVGRHKQGKLRALPSTMEASSGTNSARDESRMGTNNYRQPEGRIKTVGIWLF